MTRSRRFLIVSAGAAVLAVSGVVSALTLDNGPFADDAPPLTLAVEPSHAVPHPSPSPSASPAATGGWLVTLGGRLPTSGPERGSVWRLPGGTADQARVEALASALGLPQNPVRQDGSWEVKGRGALQVRDDPGQPWSFNSDFQPGPPATTQQLYQVNFDVLRTLGITGTTGPVASSGPFLTVTTDPVVGGQPTAGWATEVTVGPGGVIASAHGWLATPQRDGDFPMVSATSAFDRLQRNFGHRPGPPEAAGGRACPQFEVEGSLPCVPKSLVVTGASPGESLTYSGDAPILAPSWLFSTTVPGRLIPEVAIAASQTPSAGS